MPYIGRFAPSPTGPLHAGSLVAALGSYLDALVHGGQWLLRIDDADLSRVQAGSADTIAQQLKHYGFNWHGSITHTQDFRRQHDAALAQLSSLGLTYGCHCTRAQLAGIAPNALGERVYPQHCRRAAVDSHNLRAVRFACPSGAEAIQFHDRWAGAQVQNVAQDVGDFVLWRPESVTGCAGGLHNYQLTMVVDDAAQGVTHVVRGADLLGNTARQCLLYDALSLPRPAYMHLPLVFMPNGLKLSKQHGAPALPFLDPLPALEATLQHLGCARSGAVNLAGFWRAAAAQWKNKLEGLV
jgi:glutamyl-Q tRNA(Asp) synthetase